MFSLLLIALFTKHFVADFILQTQWMVEGKGKPYPDFIMPLLWHVFVHVVLTACVLVPFFPHLVWLALVEGVLHFAMDRIKANPKMLGRWPVSSKYFWVSLGFDQWFHAATYIVMAQVVWSMS